jgi:hypothetical protein
MRKNCIFLAPILFFLVPQKFNQPDFPGEIIFQEFKDNTGTKGASETRQLFKTLAAYKDYFGHNPPPEVNFSTDWVFFYSAGVKTTRGYIASVKKIEPDQSGVTLKITTSLATPDSSCKESVQPYKTFVLVKFQHPPPASQYFSFYKDDRIIHCKASVLNPNDDQAHDSSKNNTWSITPTKGIKKGMGRLNLVFPAGVEWSVDLYTEDHKFIINRSVATYKLKYSELAPGLYHFKLNTVMVENIPIEAGKTTTLKTGILEITSNQWELRSTTGDKFLTSGNRPVKIALPVGKYQLIQDGVKRPVMVD